jgi:CNT family concentrative nucleoside transporter
MTNIIFSILSVAIILAIGFALSKNKKAIKLRPIISGLAVQILLMAFVLKVPIGVKILKAAALGVQKVVNFGNEGLNFVFGDLSKGFVFAINVLALIIFVSALISLLQHIGVIPFLVKYVGKGISKLFGTTQAETFNAVGNIVLGQTEAPLLIKPYIKDLTESELFAVMVAGMGSASASILVGYNAMGIPMEYLLIAIFISPLSSLMMAKLMIPETEESKTANADVEKSSAVNIFDAIGEGTYNGLMLALNVGAMLIAFIGLVAMINALLGLMGLNLSKVLGYAFYPLGILFGIPSGEVMTFASAIGTKFAVNEFVAFLNLKDSLHAISPRTLAILSVALCNFANFASIGIQLGGFNAFAPERKSDVARLGVRALIAATLATLISGALIGMFF